MTSWLSYRAAAEASEQKIREIELAYRHKLNENYLTHARSHIDTLYMPINHCLSALAAQHYKLKASVASDKSAEVQLRQACENYVKEIEGLLYYEKDVYLTPRLYESLHSFTEFVTMSLTVQQPEYILSYMPKIGFLEDDVNISLSNYVSRYLLGRNLPIKVKTIVAAPICSPAFNDRFSDSIKELKALIREVTLGLVDKGK